MNSKPFYLSLTITGALVHLFITLAALFGVDLGDEANAITKTIEQFTLATGGLLATFSTIVGRIRASKQITLGRTPPAVNSLLLLGVAGVAACALAGCAPLSSTAGSGTSGAGPAPATSAAAGSSASTPAKSSVTASTLANIGYSIANVLQTSNDGTTLPTVDAVLTQTDNSGDIAVANLVTALVGEVASAVVAAHNTGATTTQTQAAVNAVLAPASVAQTAANVAATTPGVASGSSGAGAASATSTTTN